MTASNGRFNIANQIIGITVAANARMGRVHKKQSNNVDVDHLVCVWTT